MWPNQISDAAIFAIFAIWMFSPGPNEVFDRVKGWAMENFANNDGKFWRWLLQLVFCPWCSAIVFALVLSIIFGESFWIALAITEATATVTIFKEAK